MSDRRSDYLYDLPEELIAQKPAEQRDASRLLVLHRETGEREHRTFHDLTEFMRENDVLVINDTRVIPARLIGHRPTGGEVELLLLEPRGEGRWECLAKPAKRVKAGSTVELPEGRCAVVVEEGEEGRRIVRFEPEDGWRDWLDRAGSMPLPPYIRRDPVDEDRERYQAVYAEHDGAVAAPTAGLHFTPATFVALTARGVKIARLTLHVGIGTFRPVMVENVAEHLMDDERYEVSEAAARTINEARKNGGRIIAVGTTSVRTLETVSDERGIIHPGHGATGIFIRPPYRFKAVDALLTNFHLPGSTLIMLVSAFAGRERILETYAEAVRERYRFFSYGDAMLIF
ncbi:MAG: tRNA preQ1(34) S-adenosylmethionine ribosyltransferase-isomerase QueA [bacterium]